MNVRVLLGALALSVALGAANNALNPRGVPWLGSPPLLEARPWEIVRDPHLKGVAQGVRHAIRQLRENAVAVFAVAAALVALTLLWRRLARIPYWLAMETWFRLGMAAMLAVAAWPKLRDPAGFAAAVAQYRLLPAPLVDAFALWMPAFELVVAAGLVFTRWARELYLLLSGLWILFIVAVAQALARRLGITCGCFALDDVFSGVGESWFVLLRDVVLLVPTAWLALRAQQRYPWRPRPSLRPAGAVA